jgi:D-amino peptidase
MNVLVSVDIEGVAGVVHPDQSQRGGSDYEHTRLLMTAEANAAALGAFAGGATRVLVADAHGDMRNLVAEGLDPRVQVIIGNFRPSSMIQGAEESCEYALFVGYHARMGTVRGVLDHTHSGASLLEVSVNGRALGEIGLNTLVCSSLGARVALVTGDAACCAEALEIMPDIGTVITKWGYGRYSARSLHPLEARSQIQEAARLAVQSRRELPQVARPPFEVRLRFQNAGMADAAEIIPGFDRLDALTIRFETQEPLGVLRGRLAAQRLADAAIGAASVFARPGR